MQLTRETVMEIMNTYEWKLWIPSTMETVPIKNCVVQQKQ
jgi:hypothetical protein